MAQKDNFYEKELSESLDERYLLINYHYWKNNIYSK